MNYNFEYSIVIPVYNSHEGLKELYSKIVDTFIIVNSTYEVIFVDDFSTDKSWEILQEIKQENPNNNITIAKLSKNYGQQKTTLCGIELAEGKNTITIDDDLQIHPKEILKLIDEKDNNNFDIVYGAFLNKKHNKIRNIGSTIIKSQSKDTLGLQIKPTSFRIFKTDLREYFSYIKNKSHIFIDEILLWNTANIGAVNVEHSERKYNTSSYTNKKLFTQGASILFFATYVPLKLMIYLGFIGSILSFTLGLRFIFNRLFHDVPLGYTSIIVTILFSTSILLLMMGVIGKYINELYLSINQKPPYLLKKIIK